MANPYQGDDVDYFSAARDKEGNIDKKKAAPLVKAAAESADSIPRFKTEADPPKTRSIVTKEQMKKEGFDNLRDYLNYKQKKTRRDSNPVETPKTRGLSVETPKTDTASVKKEAPETPVKKEAPKTEARKPGRSAAANRGRPKTESTPVKVAPGATSVERMRNTMKQKFGEKNKFGMKKGGMVSSASKRADGCAKRGKTKCKMV